MKKLIFLLLFGILVFGFMGGVFADSGNDDDDDSDERSSSSSSDDDDDEMDDDEMDNDEDDEKDEMDNDDDDEDEREVRIRLENNGDESEVRIRTKIGDDGEMEEEREFKIKGYDENGNEIEIEMKIETKQKDGELVQKIKIKGYEVESESELEIENETGKLKIKLSNGNLSDVKVLPDVASLRAIENFESRDIKVELKEVREGSESKIVYEAEGNKTVRFLGLFKVKAQVHALIDAENGEVLELDEPWWYFLAFGGESDCSGDNLEMCGDESECLEAGLVWLDGACVLPCDDDERLCDDNMTVVYREEALGCEFAECPILS